MSTEKSCVIKLSKTCFTSAATTYNVYPSTTLMPPLGSALLAGVGEVLLLDGAFVGLGASNFAPLAHEVFTEAVGQK